MLHLLGSRQSISSSCHQILGAGPQTDGICWILELRGQNTEIPSGSRLPHHSQQGRKEESRCSVATAHTTDLPLQAGLFPLTKNTSPRADQQLHTLMFKGLVPKCGGGDIECFSHLCNERLQKLDESWSCCGNLRSDRPLTHL